MRAPDRLDWKIVSITGHRNLDVSSRSKVRSAMKALVGNPSIDAIYFGGADGADTEALRAALQFRVGTRPWLVVVVPDTVRAQPASTRDWTYQADEVIELGNPITSEDHFSSYRKRNEYLIDCGTSVVAFFNGNYKSGTGQAVRYAERDGVVVLKIPVKGS